MSSFLVAFLLVAFVFSLINKLYIESPAGFITIGVFSFLELLEEFDSIPYEVYNELRVIGILSAAILFIAIALWDRWKSNIAKNRRLEDKRRNNA